MVNTLLREEAMLVKEQSILVDLNVKSRETRRRRKARPAAGDGGDAAPEDPRDAAGDPGAAEEGEESDDEVDDAHRALADIEARRAELEGAFQENEATIGGVQGIMASLAATLANKTSKKEEKEVYFTHATVMEALSQIEDRVDLIVRMTSIARSGAPPSSAPSPESR